MNSTLVLLVCLLPVSYSINILLCNDDGWQGPGLIALTNALYETEHSLVVVAPGEDSSGSGAALDLGPTTITKRSDDPPIFSVLLNDGSDRSARPATSTLLGIQIATEIFGKRPDLFVSGINNGDNLGATSLISGTVGNALLASSLLDGIPMPSLAISSSTVVCPSTLETPEEIETCERNQVERTAEWFANDFLPKLVDRNGHKSLLRQALLSINFPFGEPKGVKLARQGKNLAVFGSGGLQLNHNCENCASLQEGETADGMFSLVPIERAFDSPGTDVFAVLNGYISIVPMVADYTLLGPTFGDYDEFVNDLNGMFQSANSSRSGDVSSQSGDISQVQQEVSK